MKFIDAQKKLFNLWWVLSTVIIALVIYPCLYGDFQDVYKDIVALLSVSLSTFLLTLAGNFLFNNKLFNQNLKYLIYYRICFWLSALYLLFVFIDVYFVLLPAEIDYKRLYATSIDLFIFLSPLISSLIGIFFYSEKKDKSLNGILKDIFSFLKK